MSTFPSIDPVYGVQKRSSPKTRIVRFADGYEQRIVFGIRDHQNPKIYNLTFEVSESDNFGGTGVSSSDTIENFLDERAEEGTSFDFQPPGETSTSKFVCESWSKSIPYLNRATIQATFREVFEP